MGSVTDFRSPSISVFAKDEYKISFSISKLGAMSILNNFGGKLNITVEIKIGL